LAKNAAEQGEASDVVTAHEIGTFVFCAEQWRLEYGLGIRPTNQAALKSGEKHHARKATAERSATRLLWIGQRVVIAALIALFLLWVLSR
jgi:hypothetical protein